jgi:osmotically-inducible protein OsmY
MAIMEVLYHEVTARHELERSFDDMNRVVRARTIDVDTQDGIVTLTGEARSAEERDQALKLARDTVGVKNVIDKLTVTR